MSETVYHIPAMLPECLEALNLRPDGVYVDATLGGGGHTRAILAALGDKGRLLSFDRDIDAADNAPVDDPRFTFVHGNFRYLTNFLRYYGVEKVDGILADLGVSFHHFDASERGFSFRTDAPLDMRMNQKAPLTAERLIAESTSEGLSDILRLYGDIKRPAPIVKAIENAKAKGPIATTGQLVEAVMPAINPKQQKKELAQIFQALRIVVNDEMGALRQFLLSTAKVLRPGGRLAVLTYHSLEDRLVKNFIRTGNLEGKVEKDFFGRNLSPWRDISRGAISPSPEEVEKNPRARSAKLRVAEYIGSDSSENNPSQQYGG